MNRSIIDNLIVNQTYEDNKSMKSNKTVLENLVLEGIYSDINDNKLIELYDKNFFRCQFIDYQKIVLGTSKSMMILKKIIKYDDSIIENVSLSFYEKIFYFQQNIPDSKILKDMEYLMKNILLGTKCPSNNISKLLVFALKVNTHKFSIVYSIFVNLIKDERHKKCVAPLIGRYNVFDTELLIPYLLDNIIKFDNAKKNKIIKNIFNCRIIFHDNIRFKIIMHVIINRKSALLDPILTIFMDFINEEHQIPLSRRMKKVHIYKELLLNCLKVCDNSVFIKIFQKFIMDTDINREDILSFVEIFRKGISDSGISEVFDPITKFLNSTEKSYSRKKIKFNYHSFINGRINRKKRKLEESDDNVRKKLKINRDMSDHVFYFRALITDENNRTDLTNIYLEMRHDNHDIIKNNIRESIELTFVRQINQIKTRIKNKESVYNIIFDIKTILKKLTQLNHGKIKYLFCEIFHDIFKINGATIEFYLLIDSSDIDDFCLDRLENIIDSVMFTNKFNKESLSLIVLLSSMAPIRIKKLLDYKLSLFEPFFQ